MTTVGKVEKLANVDVHANPYYSHESRKQKLFLALLLLYLLTSTEISKINVVLFRCFNVVKMAAKISTVTGQTTEMGSEILLESFGSVSEISIWFKFLDSL